eukprot:s674_g15.t1
MGIDTVVHAAGVLQDGLILPNLQKAPEMWSIVYGCKAHGALVYLHTWKYRTVSAATFLCELCLTVLSHEVAQRIPARGRRIPPDLQDALVLVLVASADRPVRRQEVRVLYVLHVCFATFISVVTAM